ncbi:MAG: AMP-binding protein, partial [Bacilli bacterium]|nr:AMP-binding protein [Bacilli bacterium]
PLEGSDDDSIGELLVRSDIVHTREYLGGALTRMNYEDGFFRTGDIASRDEQGYYYIKSRIKDTIILANGENVYPDEIEDYFKDVKHINRCVVLGAKPKGESEEMICLVVEVENSMKAEDIAQLKQDIKAINESLPSEKRVRKIFLDRRPLPMSNNMKIKRVTVKKGLEEGSDDYLDFEGKRKKVSFEGYDAERVAAMQTAVAKIFSNVLLLPEFKIDYNADWGADLSGDSMSYIEMIQGIESDLGVKIPDTLFGSLMTVNDFAKQILDMQDGKTEEKKD